MWQGGGGFHLWRKALLAAKPGGACLPGLQSRPELVLCAVYPSPPEHILGELGASVTCGVTHGTWNQGGYFTTVIVKRSNKIFTLKAKMFLEQHASL